MRAVLGIPSIQYLNFIGHMLCFPLQVTLKTLAQHDELMKKTETMNVLMDTNKMLREEKEKLDQELQQALDKVPPSICSFIVIYV